MTVAVVAVIEPDAALIVAIVMRVAGSDLDAAGLTSICSENAAVGRTKSAAVIAAST